MKSKKQKDVVTLGKVARSLWRKEKLTEGQLNHHVQIVGASGYGKSVLLSHIVKQRIEQGKGLLFIDLKGDIDTIEKFSEHIEDCGRTEDLQIFSLSDQKISSTYNLIQDGTATQLRDRIMMSLTWSEEFYKNQCASYLLKLLIGLCWLRDNKKYQFHLGTLQKASTKSEFIQDLADMIPDSESETKELMEECYKFLDTGESFKSLQGLRTQLESLVLSDFGKSIATDSPGINLFDIVANGKIVFMFLDSRRYGETAKAVGRFILQDLKSVSARIDSEVPRDERKPFSIIIDEFADLAQEDFVAFQDRARSAKMSIVFAHQEISDLERISPEFARRIMGNTSTLYAFLQKRQESAELISNMAGTRKVWKETIKSKSFIGFNIPTGDKSLREAEEFNIHPNLVKSLVVGNCVVVKKYPRSQSYLIRVSRGS